MSNTTVLIVDDSKTARLITQRILGQTGKEFDVTHAGNYDEAIEAFSPGKFDLLLIDVNMPGKNGLELAEDILKLQSDANIVIVTANTQQAIQNQVNKLNVSLIAKPFTADKLALVMPL